MSKAMPKVLCYTSTGKHVLCEKVFPLLREKVFIKLQKQVGVTVTMSKAPLMIVYVALITINTA